MSDTVKVTALGQTYRRDGKGFGPFRATAERPFLEVPLWVALVSGAPEYTGEPEADEAEGADVQQLLDANASLKADLDQARADFAHEQQQHEKTRDGYAAYSDAQEAKVSTLTSRVSELEAECVDLKQKLEEADSEISFLKLDQSRAALDANTAALNAASQQIEAVTSSTPLPEDFPMRDLLLESGFDSLEKVRAGLVKLDGAEKSPVENVQGIGKKTLMAIEAALK
ncbi:hypothetical protein [Deinococcus humi]|uniref:Regulator of replication initiation timing n=1 Tax=Deinococcus humi TaxID=662880 RepID=A0A7W8NGN8_9DEIO|nr:hypothetical protein [Deinococcus humi]MBB5364003.1 regulator of replication initiation timing [Deinococcus humi]GGO32697.1 hypothetical protein GCM10008949_30640 [Deinococcus humi]